MGEVALVQVQGAAAVAGDDHEQLQEEEERLLMSLMSHALAEFDRLPAWPVVMCGAGTVMCVFVCVCVCVCCRVRSKRSLYGVKWRAIRT